MQLSESGLWFKLHTGCRYLKTKQNLKKKKKKKEHVTINTKVSTSYQIISLFREYLEQREPLRRFKVYKRCCLYAISILLQLKISKIIAIFPMSLFIIRDDVLCLLLASPFLFLKVRMLSYSELRNQITISRRTDTVKKKYGW